MHIWKQAREHGHWTERLPKKSKQLLLTNKLKKINTENRKEQAVIKILKYAGEKRNFPFENWGIVYIKPSSYAIQYMSFFTRTKILQRKFGNFIVNLKEKYSNIVRIFAVPFYYTFPAFQLCYRLFPVTHILFTCLSIFTYFSFFNHAEKCFTMTQVLKNCP